MNLWFCLSPCLKAAKNDIAILLKVCCCSSAFSALDSYVKLIELIRTRFKVSKIYQKWNCVSRHLAQDLGLVWGPFSAGIRGIFGLEVAKSSAPEAITCFEDLRLKYCILRENLENTTSGETVEKDDFGSVGPPRAPIFYSVLLGEVNFNSAERLSSFFNRILWPLSNSP
jgi:hypothetical protein